MNGLDGKVALVTRGGEPIGRSIALALAARGVRVVVTGENERALGETVGEIAYGGGKARHVVGDVALAVRRALEVFGGLDLAIASANDAEAAFHAVAASIRDGGRLIAIGTASDSDLAAGVGATAADLASRRLTCNVVAVVADSARAVDSDEVAALVVFLCSTDARAINGRTLAIG